MPVIIKNNNRKIYLRPSIAGTKKHINKRGLDVVHYVIVGTNSTFHIISDQEPDIFLKQP